jgi:Leucine-rich repeat (LRR) protein
LVLHGNKLSTLPNEIADLANLKALFLGDNQFLELPPSVLRALQLAELYLHDNSLKSLPPEFSNLKNIRALTLGRNEFRSFPSEVINLHKLRRLNLESNQIQYVPEEIRRLGNLRSLELEFCGLTALPQGISQLTHLETLDLYGNELSILPPEISKLTALRRLSLSRNRFVTLPSSVYQLHSLKSLQVSSNQLSGLSPEIRQLSQLDSIEVQDNLLTNLPAEVGDLGQLRELNLENNTLNTLPQGLGRLSDTVEINLENNPLKEPIRTFVGRGTQRLLAYLRSLHDARPQYEAKVVLVGEGSVGKTSLVAALRGKPFVKGRSTTHGIEIGSLSLPHPHLPLDIDLNTWDFGGQEVYRITHQFFFSRRALYLLVWNPRQGQEQNEVEGWLHRIRLRLGEDARIIVVATHSDERYPELDYPSLKMRFGSILADHPYAVDNKSGNGIEDLRQAIAHEAAELPQMGELLSKGWVQAAGELERLNQPQISFTRFRTICESYGLDEAEVHACSDLFHDLGHLIYYGDDDGLRDIVVLQPEWLTKAISYVLEDATTRQAGGVLDHARLTQIWQGRSDRESYPSEYHPYFVRLMEKFDVSYRLEDRSASLVGQLLPNERPRLPWDNQPESPLSRGLNLVCSMKEVAPGLMAWLTVRNHRFSIGLHWRNGVFLVHRQYASEALFEMVNDRTLSLGVRAPSPDYFFTILRDSLEYLIQTRWDGLEYEFLVPCLYVSDSGQRCNGFFEFTTLVRYRERGRAQIECHRCIELQDVAQLLTGFPPSSGPVQLILDELKVQADDLRTELRSRTGEMRADLSELKAMAADNATQVRIVLKAIATEVADCPRLFTLELRDAGVWRVERAGFDLYSLTLWCEHAGQEHPLQGATYEFRRPKEWLQVVGPYAILVSRVLRVAAPVIGSIPGVVLPEHELKRVRHQIELMKALVQSLPQQLAADPGVSEGGSGLTAAEGAGLRALRELLMKEDPTRAFGGLNRRLTMSGDYVWICEKHYSEYDPGLPTLPN